MLLISKKLVVGVAEEGVVEAVGVLEEVAKVVVVEVAAMQDLAEVALDVRLQPQESTRQASSFWSYQY